VAGGYLLRERLSKRSAHATPFIQHSVRQLTTNGKVGNAALSPDGKLFAYTIDDLGQKSLWLGYVDGGNHLLLRPAAEATYNALAFSSDNSHIYFSIRDDKNPKSTLYKMPAFGGVQSKVLEEVGNFSLSPDGKHVAIGRRDNKEKRDFVVVAALDGSERRDVVSFPKERSFMFSTLSWSAEGDRLALGSVRDTTEYLHEITVVEISNGGTTRIPIDNCRQITKTAWLRDGSGLVITAVLRGSHSSVTQYEVLHVENPHGVTHNITADRSNYGASWHNDAGATLSLSAATDQVLTVEHRQLSNVWIAPSDNLSAARQITFSSFGKYDGLWGMDWTPDGRLIYTTSDTRSQFISRMNNDGSEQTSLTSPGFFDSVLTVSPDGRYVLFHSNRGVDIGDDIDVWRMDADGGNPQQLTFGGGGLHPAPSSDGRWIYYSSWLKGIGELCRVPTGGGEPETITDRQTIWPTFSPDGRYFSASYVTDKERLAVFSTETHKVINQFDLPKTGTLYMGSHWTADSKAITYRDNAYGYWMQTIDGGPPKRMEGLPKEKLYNFAWSRDGKWLAFVRGPEIRDVVLFTNIAK
jgi:Tol biopolymer transport system component